MVNDVNVASGERTTLAGYIKRYKEISGKKSACQRKIRTALLSSFTINGLREVLDIKCFESGIDASFYECGYNQYAQDIINPNSDYYRFEPEITFLFIDTRSLMGDDFYYFNNYDIRRRKAIIEQKRAFLQDLFNTVLKSSNTIVVLHALEVPYASTYGILENKVEMGLNASIKSLNGELQALCIDKPNAFVLDYDLFLGKLGKAVCTDEKMRYIADMKLKPDGFIHLADEYLGYIKAFLGLTKKCIVLDLDNTLWGGIVGEDGFEGIALGPKAPGNAFFEFQKYLLSLNQRGILLAINSRNNPEDAMKVIREHPSMVLKEEHFAAIRINWLNKAANLSSIVEELNIGADSVVFLDDDPVNIELARQQTPEVLSILLPEDSSKYVQTLLELNEFNVMQITLEDKKRRRMYTEQRKRDEHRQSFIKMEDFLESLDQEVRFEPANDFSSPRISQLCMKTNQFNLTTKRYSETDTKDLIRSQVHQVFSIAVKDRFGDNGIVGVLILEESDKGLLIDTFLLSCRIIGRGVERAALAFIFNEAKKKEVGLVFGFYSASKRNALVKGLFKDNGFELIEQRDGTCVWKRAVNDADYTYPDYLTVIGVN